MTEQLLNLLTGGAICGSTKMDVTLGGRCYRVSSTPTQWSDNLCTSDESLFDANNLDETDSFVVKSRTL